MSDLFDVIDTTWPATRYETLGPWLLREGAGGGQRVSATSLVGDFDADRIGAAETAMVAMGQPRLFMIRPQDTELDAALDARGYAIKDPVNIWACPVTHLTDTPLPRVTVFPIWRPLAIMEDMWAEGGIGPGRLAVMDRARGPKTGILGRKNDQPAGTAFVAMAGKTAMLHALEIRPHQRRKGMGQWFMRCAAFWAADQAAEQLTVICTKANQGANGLYASLGMEVVGQYHYRILPTET